ncbi:MAG: aminomethyltransferase beta-barrel domain-containing protein, partial [Sphingobacterium sp.]
FVHNVKGIAPGQSAVFYEGNDLLGGGFLMK